MEDLWGNIALAASFKRMNVEKQQRARRRLADHAKMQASALDEQRDILALETPRSVEATGDIYKLSSGLRLLAATYRGRAEDIRRILVAANPKLRKLREREEFCLSQITACRRFRRTAIDLIGEEEALEARHSRARHD